MISPPGESPVVLYTRDLSPERGCLSLCGNVEDLTGYPAAAFLDDPKFWNQRIHPNDKPQALDALRLCLRVGSAAIDYRFLRQDGVYVWIHDSCSLISKDNLPRGIAGTWIDITRQKYAERLTSEDPGEKVTGLVNRKTFERSLADLIADAVNSNDEHVLCYIDLDQFRVINNTCGHTAGDELLRQLGWYLQGKLRVRDTVAYLGGDEFGILLESCVIRQDHRVFAGIRQALSEFEFELAGRKISITASIGVVPINKESGSPARVLGMADIACYAAKEQGRDRVHFYTEEDEDSEPRIEMFWVDRINQAMQEDRFFLYSQPIVPLNGAAGLGGHHELLLRMKDEAGKLVPPGLFLPAAERYHLAGRIDQWVIRTALSWLDAYTDMIDPAQRIGINISGQSLANDDLLEFVLGELTHKGIAPERIYFEITETAAVANFKHAIRFINGLRDRGCHFALDDFGSGVSSFAYLKMLPVDYLKIDGAFVKEIANSPVDYAMVKAINDVGRTMGKQTIAEFVENDAIVAMLKEIGVDFAQGYGIGKPRPLNEFFNP